MRKNKTPIIGLSPMDGVTDASFRYIADTYGKSDILITEFTSSSGICYGSERVLYSLIHHQTSTPTIAQLFGSDPETFYKSAFVIAELGFDGLDINMGCPDKNINRKGGGAALIRNPRLAQEIIKSSYNGLKDWYEGKNIKMLKLPDHILRFIEKYRTNISEKRRLLPLSVKTRIGFDEIITKKWVQTILDTKRISTITLHGRTLKQMYTGHSDWEEISKAVELCRAYNVQILGSGDVKSLPDANEKVRLYGVDGVLIGRAALGNPWIFTGKKPDAHIRMKILLEHCEAFMKFTPELNFRSLRKHLAWYCKDFPNSARLRNKLMKVDNLKDVEVIVHKPI